MAKITAEKLNAELAKNTVAPVYLLTGEDVYRKNLVIRPSISAEDFTPRSVYHIRIIAME